MARSTRRSTAQRVAGLATMGLPSPIKTVAGSRVGAPLTLLAIGALLVTGVVTVEWSNGFPSISVDRQRASQVQQNIVERVETAWDERTQGAGGVHPDGFGGQPGAAPTGPGFVGQQGQGQGGTSWPPAQTWGQSGGGNPAYQPAPQPYGPPAPTAYGPPAPPYYGPPATPNYGQPAVPNYGQPATPNYGQPVAPNYNAPAVPNASPPQPESGLSRLRDALRWNR
ncbi:MAG: hypothetical protein NTY19_04330 [Planctomycetota bacterium]|nr:hypothetical protein [Planctomycetota bacterium]